MQKRLVLAVLLVAQMFSTDTVHGAVEKKFLNNGKKSEKKNNNNNNDSKNSSAQVKKVETPQSNHENNNNKIPFKDETKTIKNEEKQEEIPQSNNEDKNSDTSPKEEEEKVDESSQSNNDNNNTSESNIANQVIEYFSFEDEIKKETATEQKVHGTLWKSYNNPSNPDNLIRILDSLNGTVPADETVAYQGYINNALGSLASDFKSNHARRTDKTVPMKRDICLQNKILAIKVMKLLDLAKTLNLEISKDAKEMAAHWLSENQNAIEELLSAEKEEVGSFLEVQKTDDMADKLGILILDGMIKRAKEIKPEAYKGGLYKANNMKKIMEINSMLAQQLREGIITIQNLTDFVTNLKEKGISLDVDSIKELSDAIVIAQNENNCAMTQHVQEGLTFEKQTGNAFAILKELMSDHKNSDKVQIEKKETGLVDYVSKFEGFKQDDNENN